METTIMGYIGITRRRGPVKSAHQCSKSLGNISRRLSKKVPYGVLI